MVSRRGGWPTKYGGFSGGVVREVRARIKIFDRMISRGNGEHER